jgi:hypothetical protein
MTDRYTAREIAASIRQARDNAVQRIRTDWAFAIISAIVAIAGIALIILAIRES